MAKPSEPGTIVGLRRGGPDVCDCGAPCGATSAGEVIAGDGVGPKDGAGGNVPVAATERGGISRITVSLPLRGPSDAVRKSTERNVRSPSTDAPTRNGRGGLPSMAISATPPLSTEPDFGAATPISRNLLTAAGATAVGVLAVDVDPNSRERSPRAAICPAGAACGGADGERASRRSAQNVALNATTAQITKADTLDGIGRL